MKGNAKIRAISHVVVYWVFLKIAGTASMSPSDESAIPSLPGLAVDDINVEKTAFYNALGYAITQWAHVEYAVFLVFGTCLKNVDREAASATFYAIENFRSKLQSVNNLVQLRIAGTELFETWSQKNGLFQRIQGTQRIRNKLAHFTVITSLDRKPGWRVRLVPNYYNAMNPDPARPNAQEGFVLRDLKGMVRTFGSLGENLEAFAHNIFEHLTPPR